MDDILSHGDDRGPGRRPHRLAVAGVLVLVAVAAIGYATLARHPRSPAVSSPSLAASGQPNGPDGIGGPTLAWSDSLWLPVAGTRPTWFSPATGLSEAIAGLPTDSAGYQFVRVDRGWVIQADPGGMTKHDDFTIPPLPVWFLADGTRSATRIGPANQVAPAATADAVWLTTYPSSADDAAGAAHEVTLGGAPLGPTVRLPPGFAINQGTDRGLLLTPVGRRAGTSSDRLWNPADPAATRAFNGVIAASPGEIAWVPRCASTCQVRLLDLATGRRATLRLPAGSSAARGAFSPSGRLIALQVTSGDDGAPAMRLEVASVAGGRLTAVPGTLVSSDALAGFGWPAGGEDLVAEFIFATKVQLVSWHPGASRLAVAVIRPGQDQASLVVG
ncbi:MAG: hypothetical protein ACRDNS_28585 [Trebonia sp.]